MIISLNIRCREDKFSGVALHADCNYDALAQKSFSLALNISSLTYYLLTESEVITGKSQTEASMYWPSDSEVNTLRPGLSFPCNDQTDEVSKLFII